jgi:hypothetical protein
MQQQMEQFKLTAIAMIAVYSPTLAERLAAEPEETGSALTENLLWIGVVIFAVALVSAILYVKWRDKGNSIDLNQAPPA